MSLLVLNKSRQTWQFYWFKSAFLSGCRRIFLNLSMSKIEKKKKKEKPWISLLKENCQPLWIVFFKATEPKDQSLHVNYFIRSYFQQNETDFLGFWRLTVVYYRATVTALVTSIVPTSKTNLVRLCCHSTLMLNQHTWKSLFSMLPFVNNLNRGFC